MVEVMHGPDRVSEPEMDYERASGWCTQLICESEIALFPECMQSCAQKVVDTAGIVREAIFRQLATERTPQTAADDDGLVRLI
jgi:hypothetical protein